MIFRLFVLLVSVVSLFTFTGCEDKQKRARHEAMVEFMHGNTPDPDMAAAIAKAKATLPDFLAAMQHPAAGQGSFLIRAIFPAEGGKQQIIWINHLSYDGQKFHGQADDNTATKGSAIPRDGNVTIDPAKIADWMYQDGDKAAGGWTLRVLRKKFPEECKELPKLQDMQFKDEG